MVSKCHSGFFKFPRDSIVDRMTKQMENRITCLVSMHTQHCDFMGMWAMGRQASSNEGSAQEVTVFGWILFSTLLAFLIILSFDLCCVSRARWVNGALTQTRHAYSVYVSAVLWSTPVVLSLPHITKLWCFSNAWELTKTQLTYYLQHTMQARAQETSAHTSTFQSIPFYIQSRSFCEREKKMILNEKWRIMSHTSQPAHRLNVTESGR